MNRSVITAITVTGHGAASAGTLTILCDNAKTAPQTVATMVYPQTTSFQVAWRKLRLRGIKGGEAISYTTTTDVNVTVAVDVKPESDPIFQDEPEAEYITLTPVQPDLGEPYQGYTYDGELTAIHDPDTGARIEPARSYALPAADSSDPFAEQSFTVQGVNETHTIYFARNGVMSRWHTTLTGTAEKLWMERIDLGRSINCNLAWIYDPLGANTKLSNPTTFGSTLRPFDTSLTGSLRHNFSPPISDDVIRFAGAPTSADRAYLETAVHPMEYVPDSGAGGEGAIQDHGGDDDHPANFFDDIHYPRWDFRVSGLEGTHRLSFWTYHRRAIERRAGDTSGPYVFQACGPSLTNYPFNRAEFRTIGGAAYRVNNFHTAVSGDVSPNLTVIEADGDFAALSGLASPFTSPYAATVQAVCADPDSPGADEFAVVVATKLGATLNETRTPYNFLLSKEAPWGTPPGFIIPFEDETPNTLTHVTSKSDVGRPAGWINQQVFIITCKWSDIDTRLNALLASGLMDSAFTDIPADVTAGTTFNQ